jgi:serine/threonine protein kinase
MTPAKKRACIFGVHFLVMEYVDGVDVSRVQKRCGPLRVADACEIIRQAAVGLQHAHEHRMVHRDIKPSNLLLCRTDAHVRPPSSNITAQDPSQRSDEGVQTTVKLLDLGLALLHEGDASIARNLTDTGQVMGTLDYMAPEQADDTHAVDIRADIYSLGCTLYSLLAGEPPFAGPQFTTAVKKLAAHMQKPFPPLADRRDDIPAEVQASLDRMVAKSPADRFVTPGEVAGAIKPLTTGHDLAALLGRATQGKSPTPSGSVHETFAYLSSAFTATQPSPPSNQLAPTIDKLAATETLHSTLRRHVPKLGLFAAVGLIVLLVVCAVFMQSGKQAPLDESKVASTLRRAEPSPPSADPQSTLDSNSSSSPEGSSRRSVTATLPDSSTPALDSPLSTLDFPEPPPLEEWLQGREILTVKQDGSAMFTKIQDALDALKPRQVVEVLDRGPYRESLRLTAPPHDIGLISHVNTALEGQDWSLLRQYPVAPEIVNADRFRLNGFLIRGSRTEESRFVMFSGTSNGVVIESCLFEAKPVSADKYDHVSIWFFYAGRQIAQQYPVTIRECMFSGTVIEATSAQLPIGDVRISKNIFLRASKSHAINHYRRFDRVAISENVILSSGGGIFVHEQPNVAIWNNTISGSSANIRFAFEESRSDSVQASFVSVQNNILGRLDVGREDTVSEARRRASSWSVNHNCIVDGLTTAKVYQLDQTNIVATPEYMSDDYADRDFLRISTNNRLATSGRGGELPKYIGALPPGPAPPEGDWFTQLLDRWKEAQEDLRRMGLEK